MFTIVVSRTLKLISTCVSFLIQLPVFPLEYASHFNSLCVCSNFFFYGRHCRCYTAYSNYGDANNSDISKMAEEKDPGFVFLWRHQISNTMWDKLLFWDCLEPVKRLQYPRWTQSQEELHQSEQESLLHLSTISLSFPGTMWCDWWKNSQFSTSPSGVNRESEKWVKHSGFGERCPRDWFLNRLT